MTYEHPLLSAYPERHAAEPSPRFRRLACERGQALVEFALILPIFALLLVGMIDFGVAYNDHNDMTQLAGEAVRFAAVNSCGTCTASPLNTAIATQVTADADNQNLANGGGGVFGTDQALRVCFGYPNGDGTYNSTSSNNVTGNPVTAIVETNFDWLPFLHLAAVQLKATATQRIENTLNADTTTNYYSVTATGSNCPGYTSP